MEEKSLLKMAVKLLQMVEISSLSNSLPRNFPKILLMPSRTMMIVLPKKLFTIRSLMIRNVSEFFSSS